MRARFLGTIGIAAFYLLACFIMTYPQMMGMTNTVGDPYVDIEGSYWLGEGAKIWTRPGSLWDAAIFFPHSETLTFNQWIMGIHLVAGPVYLLTKNPILAHNFYLILTYFLNGLCMFFLARQLIKDSFAAVIAGFVFAYCPLRFSAPQLLGFDMFWICLALLWLHKFVESELASTMRGAHLSFYAIFFAFCFGMEFLTDPFSGTLFCFMIGIYLLCHLISGRVRVHASIIVNLLIALLIVVAMISPLFHPYIKLTNERTAADMTRGIEESQILSCDIISYFITPPSNLLYGWIPKRWGISRAQYVFPGIAAGLLALIGLMRRRNSHVRVSGEKTFLVILGIFSILIASGPYISFGNTRLFPGPYQVFYRYLPGFKSLRAIGWSVILALIPFAIFCGEGASWLRDRIHLRGKRIMFSLCLLSLIGIEYFNKNTSGDYFTTRHYCFDLRTPKVYEWLKKQPGNFGIIELPMPDNGGEFEDSGNENYYMIWSLYHGKRIVNGNASFRPAEYWPLIDCMAQFPSPETIEVLRGLKVLYVVVHTDRYDWNEFEKKKLGFGLGMRVIDRAAEYPDDLAQMGKFDATYVYAIKPRTYQRTNEDGGPWEKILPSANWEIVASVNQDRVQNLFDGSCRNAWDAFRGVNLYNNSNSVRIDFGGLIELSRIIIKYGNFRAFPRGLEVSVSGDAHHWETIDVKNAYSKLILNLARDNRNKELDIVFTPREVRYCQLKQTLPSLWWSIGELELYHRAATEGGGGPRVERDSLGRETR